MTKDSDVEMTQEEEASQDVSAITSTAAKMELSSNEVRKAVRETREDMQGNFKHLKKHFSSKIYSTEPFFVIFLKKIA